MAFRCAQHLLYFQRSIKHYLSEESEQRLEFTGWKSTTEMRLKCLFADVTSIMCFTSTQAFIYFN